MVRAPCCEKMGLKKGPWTPEEDHILISYIQRYGHENWRALPKRAGLLRCGKSCRLRWINYLRPDIKRGNFSLEEEEAIIKLHEMLGNRWSAIAAKLPGRTDNEIKNVWHTHLKKRLVKKSNNNLIVHDTKKRHPADAVKSMKNDNDNTTVENKPVASSSSLTNNNTGTNKTDHDNNESTKAESAESFTEIMDDDFWSEVFSSNDNNNTSTTYFELENNFYADPQVQFPLLEASDDNEDVDLVQGLSTNINIYEDNNIEFWYNVFTKDVNLPELLSQQS